MLVAASVNFAPPAIRDTVRRVLCWELSVEMAHTQSSFSYRASISCQCLTTCRSKSRRISELSAHARGKVIGLICDATFAAAKTGLLDTIDHTSNGEAYLDETGYGGKSHYQNVTHAVSDQKVITAAATAPVTFMQAVMKELGLGDDQLDYYVGMHATEHAKAA